MIEKTDRKEIVVKPWIENRKGKEPYPTLNTERKTGHLDKLANTLYSMPVPNRGNDATYEKEAFTLAVNVGDYYADPKSVWEGSEEK